MGRQGRRAGGDRRHGLARVPSRRSDLRSAERHLEVEQDRQAERDRHDKMTPKEVAREVVDRVMDPW